MVTFTRAANAVTSTEPQLPFRCYGFKELAVLFYPDVAPRSASRSLRYLIHHDPELLTELSSRGYKPSCRRLSPAQVSCLLYHLGSPSEFYEALQRNEQVEH